ncbi:MAG TPA: hypothetical protein VNT81_19885 [Vicinamibacterales bacterium]|nr:hypothetical protein [Vicinamibacterales bacterium]
MISRREVVTAGVLGTLATGTKVEAAELVQEAEALRAGFKSLENRFSELQGAVEQGLRGNSMNYGGVGQVKAVIEKYSRASGKFPDYCDIGLSIFYDVYDWHVRNQQQISMQRVSERIAIQFMFTQLIVRFEADSNFVGTPFDR